MVQLQKDSKKLKEAGITLLTVSYDSPDVLKAFGEKQKIVFPLLSDKGSKTIDAYGIRNKKMDGRGKVAGVPYPGTYILDGDGVVRAKLFLERYQVRHSSEQLIAAAKAIQ